MNYIIKAIKGISRNVKAIRKDVRDIWEELLYIEGKLLKVCFNKFLLTFLKVL